MDLKGAKIVNFYKLSSDVQTDSIENNKVNIPHYQRPYSWDKDMIKALVEDWHQQKESEYFAGSVVTVAYPSEGFHELVDGQQRFTTIYLANYLLFLLLRVTTRQAIAQSKTLKIEKLLERLKKSEDYIFQIKSGNFSELIFQDIIGLEELDGEEKEINRELIVAQFRNSTGLPDLYEGSEGYLIKYSSELSKYISNKRPLLTYDRKSFEKLLVNSLSRVVVTMTDQSEPRLKIIDQEISSVEKQYTDAIEQLFNSFKGLVENNRPFEIALNLIERVSAFIEEIKFCVVQTGDPKDAYTLFEVLNDRSKPLSDLDLIKNLFYKNYCLKSSETDSIKDSTIEELENKWGDEIYCESADYKKKYITYFSTTYLTGAVSIGYNQNDLYRAKIKDYFEKVLSYSSEDIKSDFNIFHSCKVIINIFDIKYNECEKAALKAEFDFNKSPAYKLVHLLVALKQFGVLAGYFNLLLNYIRHNVTPTFEIKAVESFVKELIENTNTVKYFALNEQAKKLSHLTILSSDYKVPREYSHKLICSNLKNEEKQESYPDLTPLNSDNFKSFNDWIDSWQFGNNLKVRIIFAKLIKTSIRNDKLELKAFGMSASNDCIDNLHLDHMEPKNIKEEFIKEYFSNESREFYVNSLGNMFPLPSQENIVKSDKPLKEAFKYIEASGLGQHWLTEETLQIFKANNENDVPTIHFFDKRRVMLKEKFIEALGLE